MLSFEITAFTELQVQLSKTAYRYKYGAIGHQRSQIRTWVSSKVSTIEDN